MLEQTKFKIEIMTNFIKHLIYNIIVKNKNEIEDNIKHKILVYFDNIGMILPESYEIFQQENLLQNDVITIFINNYNVNVSNYWPSRQNFLKYENEKFNYKNIFGNSSIIKNYTMIKNHAIKRRKLFESTEYDGNNSFFIKFDKNNNYYIEHNEKYKFEKFEKDFDFVKKEDIKIETQYNNNYCNIL